jgi:hypothetical protein
MPTTQTQFKFKFKFKLLYIIFQEIFIDSYLQQSVKNLYLILSLGKSRELLKISNRIALMLYPRVSGLSVARFLLMNYLIFENGNQDICQLKPIFHFRFIAKNTFELFHDYQDLCQIAFYQFKCLYNINILVYAMAFWWFLMAIKLIENLSN